MAIGVAIDGDVVVGSAPVRPQSMAPGTDRIRTGLLATMVDVIAGHAPVGGIGPTLDLRLQVFSHPPADGRVYVESRTLRAGRNVVVAESLLRPNMASPAFARAVTTFMNNSMGSVFGGEPPAPTMEQPSFDDFLGYTVVDSRTLGLEAAPRLTIGPGVIQGGVQALFAEVAAEHALGDGGRLVATDLDIRFLSRLKVGPMVAAVEAIDADDGLLRARVTLSDGGDDRKPVSFVSVTMAPASVQAY
ncbi:MAG: thioesterase superfamily protein [Acidimicrobiia bacterium]|nr:thioesterase superfamily protein [Acidimicrobiia bacterium]